MRIALVLCMLIARPHLVLAQNQVRAWYDAGQIWVVWQLDTNNAPATFTIWRSGQPVSDVSQAELRGRLFEPEWAGWALLSQTRDAYGQNVLTGYCIPDGQGGVYELQPGEGLFVDTARADGQGWYAVLPQDATVITPARHTTNAVTWVCRRDQPPRAHPQHAGLIPKGNPVSFYMLWGDGDTDEHAGRDDFPVMGNQHKRGAPHLFFIAGPTNSPSITNAGLPASLMFHSGGANASFWMPDLDSRARSINIEPIDGLLIALDDKMYRLNNAEVVDEDTRWFGWARGYDPFINVNFTNAIAPFLSPEILPADDDVVVNYTQRRIRWMINWLAGEGIVDPNRISVMGHSAGAMGALAFAKAHPELLSSVTVFNGGLRPPLSGQIVTVHGSPLQNLASSLNRDGVGQPPIPMNEVWNLNDRLGSLRDFPLVRVFNGKRDSSSQMFWSTNVVEGYRLADRLGWGMHLYWDLRGHGMPDWDDHWVNQGELLQQTRVDDVATQIRFHARQSFPAFFNLQDYPDHGDPGTGAPGPGDGDDHGTWGGYFDWDQATLEDATNRWACTVFLAGQSPVAVDNSPHERLMADVGVRKPQRFTPAPGKSLDWRVESVPGGAVLHVGVTTVRGDGMVALEGITVPRDPERVRILVEDNNAKAVERLVMTTPVKGPGGKFRFDMDHEPVGVPLTVEVTTNMVDWDVLGTFAFNASPLRVRDGGAVKLPQRFYRAFRAPLMTDPVPLTPGWHTLHFAHGRHQRFCEVFVPGSMGAAGLAPLYLMFHDAGQRAIVFATLRDDLISLAESHGVVLAFPEGVQSSQVPGNHWTFVDHPVEDNAPDDVGFALALVDYLAEGMPIDADRVFAAGYSDGGQMVHYLAQRTEGVFAGYAVVAGNVAEQSVYSGAIQAIARPSGPVSLLIVSGRLDPVRPYHGGTNVEGLFQVPQWESLMHYLGVNACTEPSMRLALPNAAGHREQYLNCNTGTRLVWVTLDAMDHRWPDAIAGFGVDGNLMLHEFFQGTAP